MSVSYNMIEKAKENAAKRRAVRKAEIEAEKKARADEKKEQEAKKITTKDRLKMVPHATMCIEAKLNSKK